MNSHNDLILIQQLPLHVCHADHALPSNRSSYIRYKVRSPWVGQTKRDTLKAPHCQGALQAAHSSSACPAEGLCLPTGTATLLFITSPHLLVENCTDSTDSQTQTSPYFSLAVQAISRSHLPLSDRLKNVVAAIYSYSHGEGYVTILHKKISTSTWGLFS